MDRFKKVKEILGEEYFNKIRNIKVLVLGGGGLGNFVVLNLLLNGFRNICVVDYDKVSISNLNRQFFYREEDVGKSKASALKERICKEFREVNFSTVEEDVTNLKKSFFREFDVFIDCLDNLNSKLYVISMAKLFGIPYIYGGVSEKIGMCGIFLKNYSFFEKFKKGFSKPSLSTLISIVGSLQVNLLIDFLSDKLKEDILIYINIENYSMEKIIL